MTDLLKKNINDAYNYSILYAGSLVDFVSGLCEKTLELSDLHRKLRVKNTMKQAGQRYEWRRAALEFELKFERYHLNPYRSLSISSSADE